MSVIVFATLKRAVGRLGAATVFAMIGAFAVAQVPTQDQLNAFKNLSQDQQNALLQSVLGNSDSTNGNKTDTKPNNTPETREQRDERQRQTDENKRKNKTGDGRTLRQSDENPELRADDSVLIDLTPIELATRWQVARAVNRRDRALGRASQSPRASQHRDSSKQRGQQE